MNLSFAFFREPNSLTLQFCKGQLKTLPDKWDLTSIPDGFLLSPWPNSLEIYVIDPLQKEATIEMVLEELIRIQPLLKDSNFTSVSKLEFAQQIKEIQFEIKEGRLEKVVASRNETHEQTFDANRTYKWFLNLLNNHKNAMVSLVYTPEFGLWIGATPEVLMQVNGNVLSTVSLAGTLVDPYENWTEKEALEQSVTTKFIESILAQFAEQTSLKSEVLEVKSGDIRHLKSHFKAQINQNKVQNILNVLSPTPAVSGYPQRMAIQWLQQNENYNRSLFSGFWGIKASEKMHLYVNLRCAQITQNQLNFYAGCGINTGSEVEKEWIETTAKMNVTRKYWD